MVQGLKFLSKKGFNPQNNANRKRVYEAEQAKKHERDRIQRREQALKQEREEEEFLRVTRGNLAGTQATLGFMYNAPPGFNDDGKGKASSVDDDNGAKKKFFPDGSGPESSTSLSLDNTSCDPAAEAFRRMLEGGAAAATSSEQDKNRDASLSYKFETTLQGKVENKDELDPLDAQPTKSKKASNEDGRSELEKAVGRKDRSSQNNLSYQKQLERFPQLKNAPMAASMKKAAEGKGDGADDGSSMMVQFKPLGVQIQHVRCLACGMWGHAKGDRECPKTGWNPFELPSSSAGSSSITGKGTTQAKNVSASFIPNKPSKASSAHRTESKKRRRHSRSYSSDDNRSNSTVDSRDSDRTASSEDSRILKRRYDDGADTLDASSHADNDHDRRRSRKRSKRENSHKSSARNHKKSKKKKSKKSDRRHEKKHSMKKKSHKYRSEDDSRHRRRHDSDSESSHK